MSRVIVLAALTVLLLSACGGGGTYAVAADPLNAPEKLLVGTWALQDFSIRQPRCQACTPDDFETWSGELTLRTDRTATVRMELCEQGDTPSAGCERSFVWSGDTGLLNLESLSTSEPDVRLEYDLEGTRLTTYSLLPTNDPEAGLLLLEAGTETLCWRRTD